MSTTVPPRRTPQEIASFKKLKEKIENILFPKNKAAEEASAEMYWKVGKAIQKNTQRHKASFDYPEYVLNAMAKDLRISKSVLRRSVKFAERFPVFSSQDAMSWDKKNQEKPELLTAQ